MKKITLAALALFGLIFSAKAQIQKGNVLIGGDLANLQLGLDNPTSFTGTLSPRAAWFIKDNVALGGYASFGVGTTKGKGTDVNYGIGALGRIYSGAGTEIVKHGRFFGEANVGFEGDNPIAGGSTNGLGFGVGPGFAYFVTPSIGLETLLKYNGIVGFGGNTYTNNLSLNFGFQVYLPGKATARKVRNDVK
ncbi:hypothetical protein [Mucilaginibacter arboris]|uniref:Outer membrane protein beta-barrel domain-containing protein n=1 Tax=Mucilaginibacter arboris TaxID=2682090 RepID=A0A7K1SRN5_9SPHI|nr:hypothetical protein [Mucilaginibacter arboris]MVN19961.1 hypothetical protein [Mucilaginibacter arboris]